MNVLNFLDWMKHFALLLPWVGLCMLLFVMALLILVKIHRFISFRRLLRQKVVFLELTPPAHTDQTPEATDELYAVLHGLGMRRVLPDKVRGQMTVYSLEIVSTRHEGIRFVLRVNKRDASTVESSLNSYLPEVVVKRIKDYLPSLDQQSNTKILSYKQSTHYANRLANHVSLDKKDPLAYVAGAMTKLEEGELVSMQVVITPVKVREAIILSGKVLHNEDIQSQLQGNRFSSVGKAAHLLSTALMGLTDLVREVQDHGQSSGQNYMLNRDVYERKQASQGTRPARTLSTFQQEQAQSQHDKLCQDLFYTEIRILLKMNDSSRLKTRIESIESALEAYSVPMSQSLRQHSALVSWLFSKYAKRAFVKRMPSFFVGRSSLLAASEISSLYHFPHSITGKTENVIKSLSKTLPAPVSLKSGRKADVVIGVNKHHGHDTQIALTAAERERHMYVVGGTGNGKTTMLQYMAIQDIHTYKGLAVIDPHGDFSETLLKHIPKDRIEDVIYINPDDLDFPVGINLLEIPEGLTGNDIHREKSRITEAVVSIFRKLFSDDDSGGHRIEYVLRNCVLTALTLPDPTLFTVLKLLNNAEYRKSVTSTLEDEELKEFWDEELGQAGDYQRVKMSAGITNKVGRYRSSPHAKRMLSQVKSTIDFDEIIDSGKILICNFSKGRLGEDNATLFGTTILAKLQMAALRRAAKEEDNRVPFFLYVDEFQNFATTGFMQMLSEGRKYKLYLTMAEQSTAQLDEQQMVNVILANVGTVICFRSGSPDDERFLLPLFKPYIDEGEIANLPSFNFYARIAAVQSQEPLSGETLLLPDMGSKEIAKQVLASSRKLYASKYVEPPKSKPTEKKSTGKKAQEPKKKILPKIDQPSLDTPG
ncbi:ATP-binding protein [Candidatus Saccharibacteria bacterium]|nr:ATP-binding protein [Candidatus Saccharibacteria bacterium]